MNPVESYIYDRNGEQREIMMVLHHMFVNDFNLRPKISYRIPFYYQKSWICCLNPLKNGNIELMFTRGNELSNEEGLLDFKNRKQVAGIEFSNATDIPLEGVVEILNEALVLDETVPYRHPRRKK